MISRRCAGLAALLCTLKCWAALAGVCLPSQMGQPCARGGAAQQGSVHPGVNIGAGNPIHVATGNKYQRDTDLPALPGLLGLEIVRHYNSRDPRQSALGQGWNFSYEARLYSYAHRTQILQADGSRIDFECSAQNCHAAESARGTLHHHSAGWSWRWPDGRLLQFDASGRLIFIAQPPYRPLSITRDDRPGPTQHLIVRVIDPQGRQLDFGYEVTAMGARLAVIDSPLGRFIYRHDTAGSPSRHRLLSMTRPNGMSRLYLYESALQSGHPMLPTGVLLRASNGATLRTHTWGYDAQARAILSAHGGPADSYDRVQLQYAPATGIDPSTAGVTQVRSTQGLTHIYWTRRGAHYVVTQVRGDGCPGCPAAGLTASYDAAGRVIGLNRLQMERRADGQLKRLRTDTRGWPGLQLEYGADGRVSWWTSAVTGREVRKRDGNGHVIERHFANGDVWRYAYDTDGKPVEMMAQSAGKSLRTTLAWRNGHVVTVTHPHEIEQRRHDAAGRLIERRIWRPSNPLHQPAFGYVERYLRDATGRITQHALPEGGRLLYRWNAHGHLLSIVWEDAAGMRQTLLTTPADDGPGYLYGNGLRMRGLVQAGRLSALVLDDGTPKQGLPLMAQTLHYDSQGRITLENLVAPAAGRRLDSSYVYDGEGQLIGSHTRHASAEHVASHNIWYAWDTTGALRARTPLSNRIAPIERDASGLPRTVGARRLVYGPDRRLAEVRQEKAILARYLYNAYGEQILRRNAGVDVFNLYDNGRLVAQAGSLPGGIVGIERRYVYAGWTPVALINYARPAPLYRHAPSRTPVLAEVLAIHTDATAAPRLLTDRHQQVRWYAELSATGELVHVQGNVDMPLRLAGQVADPSTGWHANYLRTYDPTAGHYLEPDPVGPLPGGDVYGYAAQQPRRHADPLGLLLFAFDGTRNNPTSATNVWLMTGLYRDGPSHYIAGPGQDGKFSWDAATASSAPHLLTNQWNKLLKELAARHTWDPAIPVDLLGYSRGAALARHFGNQIATRMRNGRFWVHDDKMGTVTACVDPRFMGLFDTVAQFGLLGLDDTLYDLSIAAEWAWVAHAIALNERRWLFPLTSLGAGDNTVEAPFLGAHGDIGGGYLVQDGPTESGPDLSNVALNWMTWQARAAGVTLTPLPPTRQRVTHPVLHDERSPIARYSGDRAVYGPHGELLKNYQDDMPKLGRRARKEVEAYIKRAHNWLLNAGNDVGTVDMKGYSGWLWRTLGMEFGR